MATPDDADGAVPARSCSAAVRKEARHASRWLKATTTQILELEDEDMAEDERMPAGGSQAPYRGRRVSPSQRGNYWNKNKTATRAPAGSVVAAHT